MGRKRKTYKNRKTAEVAAAIRGKGTRIYKVKDGYRLS